MSVTVIASRRSARADDDRALARRAGRGDEAAFAELYDRHAAGLVGFAQQYVGERGAAEDVVQQTFFSAFRTLQDGTALEHPRAWLYHVARNNALTVVRDRRPAIGSPLEEDLLDRAAAVPAQIEQREALEEVVRDIVSLPAQQRAALALFEVGDLSQAEIAEVLECTPAQVKALVFQARSTLVSRREARSATCASVREALLAARGGALNRRLIRHHLRQCEPCTAFRDDLRDGRRRVALLLPVLPAAALRESVLGAAAGGSGKASVAGAAVLARPRHPWWIAGGAAAAVGAVGLAALAWPGATHRRPDATVPHPVAAAATATAEPVKLGGSRAKAAARPATTATASRRHARRPAGRAALASVRQPPRHAGAPSRAGGPATAPAPAPAARPPRTGPPTQQRVPTAPPRPSPHRPAAPAPSAPPAAAAPPPPAAAVLPAVDPTPAAPAPAPATPPAPSPSAPCTDHSHASEQGLEHGNGHQRC